MCQVRNLRRCFFCWEKNPWVFSAEVFFLFVPQEFSHGFCVSKFRRGGTQIMIFCCPPKTKGWIFWVPYLNKHQLFGGSESIRITSLPSMDTVPLLVPLRHYWRCNKDQPKQPSPGYVQRHQSPQNPKSYCLGNTTSMEQQACAHRMLRGTIQQQVCHHL